MTLLEKFIKNEEKQMNWIDKIFSNDPKIVNTKNLVSQPIKFKIEKNNIVRPSIFIKLVSVLFLLFAFGFWFILFLLLLNKTLVPVTAALLLFVSFMMGVLIWTSFFNRKYNFTIKLCNDYMEVNRRIFPWYEISDTYIMIKPVRRGNPSNLVIFSNDCFYKYSLFHFGVSDKKLSTLIEFYKQKGTRNLNIASSP